MSRGSPRSPWLGWLLLLALVVGGLWTARVGFDHLLDLRRLASVPDQSPAAPVPGPARVRGQVEILAERLTTPAGEPAVYHRREHQSRRYDSENRMYWHAERREDHWVDFLVRAGGAAIPVLPASAAHFDVPVRAIEAAGSGRVVDWTVAPGDDVIVVGMFRPGPDGLELVLDGPGYFHPLIAVDHDHRARHDLLLWGSVFWWLGTGLLILAALLGWLVHGHGRVGAFVVIVALVMVAAPVTLGGLLLQDDRSRLAAQDAWLREHAGDAAPVMAARPVMVTRIRLGIGLPALLGTFLLLGWAGSNGRRHLRNHRALLSTVPVTGPLPERGVVALAGIIRLPPGATAATAPLSGRPCVWVEYTDSVRARHGWHTKEKRRDAVPFLVSGPFGEVLIDPRDAEVCTASMSTQERDGGVRHERRLGPGKELYALGSVHPPEAAGRPSRLGPGARGTPFFLSGVPADEAAAGEGLMVILYTGALGFALTGAVVFALGLAGATDPARVLLGALAATAAMLLLPAGLGADDRS